MANLPFYEAAGNEVEVFEHAWRNHLPVLIKGPTGGGQNAFCFLHGSAAWAATIYGGLSR